MNGRGRSSRRTTAEDVEPRHAVQAPGDSDTSPTAPHRIRARSSAPTSKRHTSSHDRSRHGRQSSSSAQWQYLQANYVETSPEIDHKRSGNFNYDEMTPRFECCGRCWPPRLAPQYHPPSKSHLHIKSSQFNSSPVQYYPHQYLDPIAGQNLNTHDASPTLRNHSPHGLHHPFIQPRPQTHFHPSQALLPANLAAPRYNNYRNGPRSSSAAFHPFYDDRAGNYLPANPNQVHKHRNFKHAFQATTAITEPSIPDSAPDSVPRSVLQLNNSRSRTHPPAPNISMANTAVFGPSQAVYQSPRQLSQKRKASTTDGDVNASLLHGELYGRHIKRQRHCADTANEQQVQRMSHRGQSNGGGRGVEISKPPRSKLGINDPVSASTYSSASQSGKSLSAENGSLSSSRANETPAHLKGVRAAKSSQAQKSQHDSLAPWSSKLLEPRATGNSGDGRSLDVFASSNGINGGSGLVALAERRKVLGSPADTPKLRRHSSRPPAVNNQHTAAPDKTPVQQGRVSFFLDTPDGQGANPANLVKNGVLRPISVPTSSKSTPTRAEASALARRFQSTSDASDEEAECFEGAMRKHDDSPSSRASRSLVSRANRRNGSMKLSQSLMAGFTEENEIVIVSDDEWPSNKKPESKSSELDATIKGEPARPLDRNETAINPSIEEIRSSGPKQVLAANDAGPKDRNDGQVPSPTDRFKSRANQLNIFNTPEQARLAAANWDNSPDFNTSVQASEQSPDIRAFLGSMAEPVDRRRDVQADESMGLQLEETCLPEDLTSFLEGKTWRYEYGSSRAPSSSLDFLSFSDNSAVGVNDRRSMALDDGGLDLNAVKPDNAKLTRSSDGSVERNRDNRDGSEDLIWLGEHRTDDYEKETRPQTRRVDSGEHQSPSGTEEQDIPIPPTAGATAGVPADVSTRPSDAHHEKDELNSHAPDQVLNSQQSPSEAHQVTFQADKELSSHGSTKSSAKHKPFSGSDADAQSMPPPMAKVGASTANSAVKPASWMTPRTPAMSDERGLSSQLTATPSKMFDSSTAVHLEKLKAQNRSATAKQGKPRSLSKARTNSPQDERGLDNPEVVEAWDHLRELKKNAEAKEMERKKQAQLLKIEKETSKLEKRVERASKPPRIPARGTTAKTTEDIKPSKPRTNAAPKQSVAKSLEQRAKGAKAATKKKYERSSGTSHADKDIWQALDEFREKDDERVELATRGPAAPARDVVSTTPAPSKPRSTTPIAEPPASTPPSVPSARPLYEPSTPQQASSHDPFHLELFNSPSSDPAVNAKLSAYFEGLFRERERQRPADAKRYKFAAIKPSTITPDDLLVMKLRSSGLPWKDVHTEWETRSGRQMREESLRHRYTKLITTINEFLLPGNGVEVAPLKEIKVVRPSSPAEEITFDEHGNAISNKPKKGKGKDTNAGEHPNTGGKNIDPAYWAELMASYTPSPSPEPEVQPARCYREPSPITERDRAHYVYQAVLRVVRLDSGEDFDDVEPIAMCDATPSHVAANEAAAEAFRKQQTFAPYDSHSYKMIGGNKAHWEGTLEAENKKVQVQVIEGLRSFLDNILPESKEGWVARTCYMIVEKILIFEDVIQIMSQEKPIEIAEDVKHVNVQDAGEAENGFGWDGFDGFDSFDDFKALFGQANTDEQNEPNESNELSHSFTGGKRLPSKRLAVAEKRLPGSTSQPATPANAITPVNAPSPSNMTSKTRRIISSSQQTLKNVYTAKDMANREASKHFVKLQHQLGRLKQVIDAEAEERAALLDNLQDRDAFLEVSMDMEDEEGRQKEVSVCVEAVELRGPRNV